MSKATSTSKVVATKIATSEVKGTITPIETVTYTLGVSPQGDTGYYLNQAFIASQSVAGAIRSAVESALLVKIEFDAEATPTASEKSNAVAALFKAQLDKIALDGGSYGRSIREQFKSLLVLAYTPANTPLVIGESVDKATGKITSKVVTPDEAKLLPKNDMLKAASMARQAEGSGRKPKVTAKVMEKPIADDKAITELNNHFDWLKVMLAQPDNLVALNKFFIQHGMLLVANESK